MRIGEFAFGAALAGEANDAAKNLLRLPVVSSMFARFERAGSNPGMWFPARGNFRLPNTSPGFFP